MKQYVLWISNSEGICEGMSGSSAALTYIGMHVSVANYRSMVCSLLLPVALDTSSYSFAFSTSHSRACLDLL